MADCWIVVNDIAAPHDAAADIKAALESFGHTLTYKDVGDTKDTSKDLAIGTPELTGATDVGKYANDANIPYLYCGPEPNNCGMATTTPTGTRSGTDVKSRTESTAGPGDGWWASAPSAGTTVDLFDSAVTLQDYNAGLLGDASEVNDIARRVNATRFTVWAWEDDNTNTLADDTTVAVSHQACISYQDYDSGSIGWSTDGETMLGEMATALSGVGPSSGAAEAPAIAISAALTVADVQTYVEAPDVTPAAALTVADTQTFVDAPAITLAAALAAGDAQTYVDAPSVGVAANLTVVDAIQTGESLAMSFAVALTVADTQTYVEAPAVTVGVGLTVGDAQTYVESPAVDAAAALTVDDQIVVPGSESPAITVDLSLTVADVQTYVEAVSIAADALLAVSDVQSYIEALGIALTLALTVTDTVINPTGTTPAERVFAIAAENRTYAVPAESRVYAAT